MDFGAALRTLRQQRRRRVLVLEVFVDHLGFGDDHAVGVERGGFTERIDLRVFGGAELAAGDRSDLDVESLFVNDEPGLGGEVGEIDVVELHRGSSSRAEISIWHYRRPLTLRKPVPQVGAKAPARNESCGEQAVRAYLAASTRGEQS